MGHDIGEEENIAKMDRESVGFLVNISKILIHMRVCLRKICLFVRRPRFGNVTELSNVPQRD